jgi:hypothetical protein
VLPLSEDRQRKGCGESQPHTAPLRPVHLLDYRINEPL